MNFQLRARFSGAKCSFRATMGQGATTAGIGLSTAVLDRFTLGMDLPQRADQGWYGGTLQPDLTFAIVGVPDGHVQPVFRFHNFIDAVESSVRAALYCRNPGKNWHRSSQCRRRPHRTCAEKAAPFSQTQDTTDAAASRQSAAVLSQTWIGETPCGRKHLEGGADMRSCGPQGAGRREIQPKWKEGEL